MRQQLARILLVLPALTSWLSAAPARTDHVEAELVAEDLSIQPGRPFVVGLRMKMEEHWHTYWQNPGDSGMATTIQWRLPEGFKAGPIQWPRPIRIPTPPFMTYGFEGEILLMTEIVPPPSLAAGASIELRAHANWLVCKEACFPGDAEVALVLPVTAGEPQPDPARSALFAEARRQIPATGGEAWPATFRVEGGTYVIEVDAPAGTEVDPAGVYFFPTKEAVIEPAQPQRVSVRDGVIELRLVRHAEAPAELASLEGVLTAAGGFPPSLAGRAVLIEAEPAGAGGGAESLGLVLVLAFAGGLVLNLMPCVFPVLGIKVLGFVQQAGEDRAKVKLHGLVFAAGVLVSFWVLAGILLALRSAGMAVGWGYQLQVPAFVFLMAVVMLVFALSLSGVFEIGSGLVGAGSDLQRRRGFVGSFFSGVLATVVATPCAAPFLGVALGAALALPAVPSLLAFTMIALGLAAPYLVLSVVPQLVRVLPRPGVWMESFKQLMAFPLYATAGFLLWVLAGQVDDYGLLFAVLGLTLIAMAAWVVGRWSVPVRSAGVRWAGRLVALSLVAGGVALGLPRHEAIEWQPWSERAVADLRAEGRVVYVDFTARWCVTCQTNKATVFSSDDVIEAFREGDVATLKADWTNRDPEITRALASFGRSAVPFNLVYIPGRAEPIVLPELLTPGIVLEALRQARAVASADRE